ncbi:MAG TPA: glycogen/starch/alpha-glucan phosphorylase [Clostridiaceae bacterium]|jgi:starch phosphorylase|nr:glycogen/starch/alpha-glucan phosphorylase [Clostridiaceae bacterium]
MNYKHITSDYLRQEIVDNIKTETGKMPQNATMWDYWQGLSRSVIGIIAENWDKTQSSYEKGKQAYYMSLEYLEGRSLLNNLVNLGLYESSKEAMASFGVDLTELLEQEIDPGLGNGGLGRLAACFLDSCATLNLPVTGYGILYRFGLFRQTFENGFQKEYPDSWMEHGYPFIVPRYEDKVVVRYNDVEIFAIPCDMPITGFGTDNVNRLRLWKSEPAKQFDFNLFNSQRFDDAVIERNRVNDIWRVLYPNDTSYDGKVLRVRQQYFFVSASLQDIVRRHIRVHGRDLSNFAELNTIQLNDTHPVVAIPELMRILMDEHGFSWEQAWPIVRRTFAYTNHTIMGEALEKWDISIFQYLFSRVYEIVEGINNQFRKEMSGRCMPLEQIDRLAPLGDGKVRMAWLAIYGSRSVNGVAALHTEILKSDTLKDWYALYPEKFSNKTNGVTPRRWLRMCNPELSSLITELLGNEEWVTDLSLLAKLEKYADDSAVMDRFLSIKRYRKELLAHDIKMQNGIDVNPDSVFDIQIKRLHEYKRQLLNAIYVLDLYYRIKADPTIDLPPVTVFFGAKAAPGYFRAKGIIKFINEISKMIRADEAVNDRINIVFVENYNVSKAEKMFPAADISEQISTVGLEASGTGNMKFMINGAVTLGTMDGANVEIAEAVGCDNIYIFGCKIEDMEGTRAYYNPQWQYENVEGLKRVLDTLIDGTFDDSGTGMFRDIYNSLLCGSNWQPGDVYYILGDFEDYRKVRDSAYADYKDHSEWARKCWINICRSGRFSSDRTIAEYAGEIWNIKGDKI